MIGAAAAAMVAVNGAADKQASPKERHVMSAEMAKHSSEGDLWVAVQGKVYDVTAWLPRRDGRRPPTAQPRRAGRDGRLCDRTAKLKLKIKLNGHHLNSSGTFGLTV